MAIGLSGQALASDESPLKPSPPSVEQATFRLADPALQIELVAAEPDVASPVAIAWDADGVLYVAEMLDYPTARTAGRIRRLEDRDGNGTFEHVTIFADGLPFPNGVMPYLDGVLVTAAPDILFLRDADHDGRSDTRRVVLSGFGEGNTQLRVNGLTWGLDNWIYDANGRSDGEIRIPGEPASRAVSIRRRDLRFRFDPRDGRTEVQAVAGFSQFGLPHDGRGNRFPSWNTIPIRQVALEQWVLDRNPYLAETTSVASILDEADGGRIYAISPLQARFNRESIDYFNASCGPTIYRGDLLPAAYHGNAFVCEPLTNLVHRRVLEPDGNTFKARRVEPHSEFLAAGDPAFRPVNLANGPDGALYVVDMYRELVEHPDFVPPDLRSKIEFRRWHDRGRIWRISGREAAANRAARARPNLSKATSEELARKLGHPVGWVRDTAQRLLVERQDRSVIPLLEQLFRSEESPMGRLHLLWTLKGLGSPGDELAARGAIDRDPLVREHALRLIAEDRSLVSRFPRRLLFSLAKDPAIRVRLQAAIALGQLGPEDPETIESLAALARRDSPDLWIRLAVLSGLGETAPQFLHAWSNGDAGSPRAANADERQLLSAVAAIIGARRRDAELRSLLSRLTTPIPPGDESGATLDGKLALAAGLGEGLERSGTSLPAWLAEVRKSNGREEVVALHGLWKNAQSLITSEQPVERRRLAFDVLVRGAPELAAPLLPTLIRSDQPQELQLSAAQAAGRSATLSQVETMLDQWNELALGTRRTLLASLAPVPSHASSLIAAIEDQKISVMELDRASRDALLRVAEPPARKRLESLLARFAPASRARVLERYQAALELPTDRSRGEAVFSRNCQSCHEFRGRGHRVGPELSGISGRPPSVLLVDILDPNRDVAPDFLAVAVVTHNGQVHSGLLVEETATSLKLRQAEGLEKSILRSEITEIHASGMTLMPEGLEQAIGPQDMADLLSFLRSGSR